MNQATKHLISHGIKPSIQRIGIMKYLLEHRNHPSVDKIYTSLSEEIPTLSRTTVYNTLKLLEEHNALVSLTVYQTQVRYDGNVMPHAHFMCRVCGMIYDTSLPQELIDPIPGMEEFKIEAVKLYYKGVCNKCLGKEHKEIV